MNPYIRSFELHAKHPELQAIEIMMILFSEFTPDGQARILRYFDNPNQPNQREEK